MRRSSMGRFGVVCALLLLVAAAPVLATDASNLCAANADPCVVSTAVAVTNLSVIDLGARELRVNAAALYRIPLPVTV